MCIETGPEASALKQTEHIYHKKEIKLKNNMLRLSSTTKSRRTIENCNNFMFSQQFEMNLCCQSDGVLEYNLSGPKVQT
jgi:hypothetical protein